MDETVLVVLFFVPAVVPVTVTLNVQELPAAMELPVNEMPSGDVVVSVPPHCEDDESVTVTPKGKVSVNATPVNVVLAFGLERVNARSDVLPVRIGVDKNDFEMLGGAMTRRESVAKPLVVLFSPDSVEEIYPVTFSR